MLMNLTEHQKASNASTHGLSEKETIPEKVIQLRRSCFDFRIVDGLASGLIQKLRLKIKF